MTGLARLAILLHVAGAAASLALFAVVRPPVPERVAKYRGPIAWLGWWAYWVTGPLLAVIRALGITANGVTAI
ncbi:MAG TPA: CDP-alcohol phosphatidyltransferase family protein, partial [Anaeromyxobacteraceae bacterium]|nr:CDP-alcohol phosphatidyltransferase family protein [Anaeromyxobacteraceae bacterium]